MDKIRSLVMFGNRQPQPMVKASVQAKRCKIVERSDTTREAIVLKTADAHLFGILIGVIALVVFDIRIVLQILYGEGTGVFNG